MIEQRFAPVVTLDQYEIYSYWTFRKNSLELTELSSINSLV